MANRTIETFGATGEVGKTISLAPYGSTAYTETALALTEVVGLPGTYRAVSTGTGEGAHYGIDSDGARWHYDLLDVTDFYIGSLEPIRASGGGSAPTAAEVATAIWTDPLASSDFATASSIGKLIKDNLDAAISSRSTFAGGAVASVTGNVGGNVVGSVNSVFTAITLPTIPTDWITAAGIATDAIGASELAASAVTEIQAGLATPTNITAATGVTLASVTHTGAVIPTVSVVTGLTASNLDAAVSSRASQVSADAIDDLIDTELAAVKAKTDQLTFTVANQVDANALSGGGAGLTAAETRAALGMASANLDTQLGDLPTNAELTTALGTADDAVLAAIAALNDLSSATVLAGITADHGAGSYVRNTEPETGLATAANLSTLAAKFSGITLLAQWLGLIAAKHVGNTTARTELNATGAGSGTFDETTDSEQALRDRGDVAWVTGAASGSGARLVTVTVNDGVAAIQNATVRASQGAESYSATTNVSGVAVFSLDDATWTVTIAKPLYTFTPTTIIVNGTETATYSMTATVITPPTNPSLSAVAVLCLDSTGQIEAGVLVDIRIITVPVGSQNIAFKGAKQTATSDSNGIARFEVVRGSTCEWKRGLAEVWQQVAIDNDSATNVTSVIGSP